MAFKAAPRYIFLLWLTGCVPAYPAPTAPQPVLSVHCLGSELMPISINNHSEVLVRSQKLGSLAILRHDKLFPIGLKASSASAMNDRDNVLVADGNGRHPFIWKSGHRYSLRLPPNYTVGSPCINNNEEVLVDSKANGAGFYKNGKITHLFSSPSSYRVHANYMNDKHQVVGVVQGPFGATAPGGGNLAFTSRAFLWDKGKFRYLPSPHTGFCYPTGVNNRGEIIGEYRPEHGSQQISAVVWRTSTTPMIDLNSLNAGPKSWHLSVNISFNDRDQIIGFSTKNGKSCPYLCQFLPRRNR